MGGRVAESIVFGDENITTGASQDIKQATKIAKKMIINWGMSEKLGFRSFYDSEGYYLEASDQISQETSERIDSEIRCILDSAYSEVEAIVTSNRDKLEAIALQLIKKETLTGEEVKKIVAGEQIDDEPEADYTIDSFSLGGLPNTSKKT
jgi:cell division protease FtsH